MFVFLPDSMLPCERQDLKTLSIVETKYFVMNTLINSSRRLWSFLSRILLAVAVGGTFPVSRRVELMVWGSRDSDRQCGGTSVLNPFWWKWMYFTVENACVIMKAVMVWRVGSRKEYWNIVEKSIRHHVAHYSVNAFYFCLCGLFKAKWYKTQYFV